jgi:hypothetical protein
MLYQLSYVRAPDILAPPRQCPSPPRACRVSPRPRVILIGGRETGASRAECGPACGRRSPLRRGPRSALAGAAGYIADHADPPAATRNRCGQAVGCSRRGEGPSAHSGRAWPGQPGQVWNAPPVAAPNLREEPGMGQTCGPTGRHPRLVLLQRPAHARHSASGRAAVVVRPRRGDACRKPFEKTICYVRYRPLSCAERVERSVCEGSPRTSLRVGTTGAGARRRSAATPGSATPVVLSSVSALPTTRWRASLAGWSTRRGRRGRPGMSRAPRCR